MRNIPKRSVDLSTEEKRKLLAQWLEKKRSTARSRVALSFAQQRLWVLDQLEPGSPVYNIPAAFHLRGSLNVTALEGSFNEILRRHEALRTTFSTVDGQPVQVIAATLTIKLPLVDLRQLSESEREEEAQRLATEEARRPFNLTQGPLLRTKLLRLTEEEHILLLTMHHIVSDGWSMGVFFSELSLLYEAFCTGKPSPLPDLSIQYADFAVWQKQWLQGEVLEKQLTYWKQRLESVPVLELPTDRPRPVVQTYKGARESVVLSKNLSKALKALSQQEGATLFMTLLAAFKILLYRYTGQNDIFVGSPIANRNRAEIEGLIGFFVNTLVLRTKLSGNPSFRELLGRLREVCLGAYAHQDLPFEKLVEELEPERDLSRNPLFQFMYILQNVPTRQNFELSGLTVSSREVDSGTAKFDLTLSIIKQAEGLKGIIEYNTDLFDGATIKRMLEHFQTLLEGIIANPEQRVSNLPLLTEAERHQLLVEWNDTQADYPKDLCIHQLFDEQVKKTPDAIAVVFEEQQLTYRELNARANQLAHYLKKRGIGPDVLVGICVERSMEMVVGLLGILKAGGAYVPLDPSYPKDRLAYMVEDAQPPVLLTQRELQDVLLKESEADSDGTFLHTQSPSNGVGEHSQLQVVYLDSDWDEIAKESPNNPESETSATNLAYVIYTSGSTGKPKGVAIQHGSLINFLFSMRERPGLTEADNLFAVTTLSFDIAGLELYLPLIAGGCVILAGAEVSSDGRRLGERLTECGATVMQATPATWRLLLDSGWKGNKKLKILCGGEALPGELANQLLECGASLWNLYGPTETTIWSAIQQMEPTEGGVSIGRPTGNTQIYLLDRSFRPVPVGVYGDLYIGGDGLARGYLNRPELTAEKFIPNPFSEASGVRLYKTGDLARYLPDGNIEFLGRMDDQVKVRGFRIELGEIEAVLCQHQSVQEAVLLFRDDEPGEKRLVAYFVANQKQEPTTRQLRKFLKKKLPEYMVPSAFVMLEALPLTPNGKVDRQALPAPDQARPELERAFVAPRSPIEEVLTEIWSEILGLEQVGVHDNFFDLGGHSLLATQVMSRVCNTFQMELPLRKLFDAPTIADLAEKINMTFRLGQELQAPPPMPPVSRNGDLPLSFAQQRLWFINQLEPDSTTYNIPEAILLKGSLNVAALKRSFNEIVRRHEALRTTFATVDGQPIQVIAATLTMKLHIVNLGELSEAEREREVRRLATEEGQKPFDLSQGPLLRINLLRLAKEEHVLLLTIHHIVSDGWSMGVFFRELSGLYQSFSTGKSSPLRELLIQYADFAIWQRQWLQGEVLENQLSYWKQQLEHIPVLELPTDRPRPVVQTYKGSRESVVLSKNLSKALKALSQQEGATLFMTLLAAFKILLHRYTGQEDVIVGSPIANRNKVDIEGLIGFFVNTLVLRTELSGNPSFRELLGRVQEVCLAGYSHQDLPFEKLVVELQPERDFSRNPLFQVMFVLQHIPIRQAFELSELKLSSMQVESGTTKFDLTLSMVEEEDGLRGMIGYNTDLFDRATIKRMLEHFQTLLEGIVANPEQRISELPLLRETERHQLLVKQNATKTDYSRDKCVQELFEAQAQRRPDAVAVVFEDIQLTYRELNSRANQLAHHLLGLGVGPEVLVGLCMERSLEMVVGLLAILKAGGAYLPLDPSYPKERLSFMLVDSEALVLLTNQKVGNGLSEHCPQVLSLHTDWPDIAHMSEENPTSAAKPDNRAYVIYTSGSTGKPKGIQITHRAAINFLESMSQKPGLTERDILLAVTTLSFDIALLELFLPLIVGAKVVVVSGQVASDGRQLQQKLADTGATIMQATPASWRLLLEAGWRGSKQLKILCGGEALSHDLANQLLKRSASLWNLYGPTEATVWSTVHQVDFGDGPVCIGHPIANTQVYILDAYQKPSPIGVPGELFISGDGLALGYLNRPELTAESFVPNPFSTEPGTRLYKTGDLVRNLPDGSIEFLGRKDYQVKIRGFRLELGEIEAVCDQHPAILESVVMTREIAANDNRLIAYIKYHSDDEPTVSELRKFLREKLPDYMVPSIFMAMDTFPLTSNRKVDRKRLPIPDGMRSETSEENVAPSSPMEKLIAEVWQEVLGMDGINVLDNFFDVGGHSLLSMKVIFQLKKKIGLSINPREIMLNNLQQLAAFCKEELLSKKNSQPKRLIQKLFNTIKRAVSN